MEQELPKEIPDEILKKLKTQEELEDIPLEVPRDRNSSFNPIIVPKHQRMSSKIEKAIITMYSKGMSTRDIEDTVKDIYDQAQRIGCIIDYCCGY